MDEGNRLKLILLGIFLAVIVLGYFLYNRLIVSRNEVALNETPPPVVRQSPLPSPTAVLQMVSPAPTHSPAPAVLGQNTTKSLPNTGAPEDILAILTLSIIIAGFSLRKFPN